MTLCVWRRGASQAESTTSAKALWWCVLDKYEERQGGLWSRSSISKGKMVGNEVRERIRDQAMWGLHVVGHGKKWESSFRAKVSILLLCGEYPNGEQW